MSEDPREALVLGSGTLWAFAGTVLSSSAAAFSLGIGAKAFAATALGLAMFGLAARCAALEASRTRAYFAAQSLLALGVLVLSEGRGVVVVMPLVSQLALVSRRRGVVAYAAAWGVLFVAVFGPRARSLGLLAGQIVAFLAAAVFTVAFTEVAARERRARTESERLAAELAEAQMRIAELAVAGERARLASEIHDGLGHALTAARMQIEGAGAVLERDPAAAKAALEKASRLVRDGLADVRQSVRALRGVDPLGATLPERLRQLVRETSGDLHVELVVLGEARRLPPAEEHALFRAAQEALTNVGRHARASRATVTLDLRAPEISLEIADDGEGRDVVFGVGLTGMRERLERCGGRLVVGAREGGGVRVRAVVAG